MPTPTLDSLLAALYTKENVEFLDNEIDASIQKKISIMEPYFEYEGLRDLFTEASKQNITSSRALTNYGIESLNNKLLTKEEYVPTFERASAQVKELFSIVEPLPDVSLKILSDKWYKNIPHHIHNDLKVIALPIALFTTGNAYYHQQPGLAIISLAPVSLVSTALNTLTAYRERNTAGTYRNNSISATILPIAEAGGVLRHEYTHHAFHHLVGKNRRKTHPQKVLTIINEGLATYAQTTEWGSSLEQIGSLEKKAIRLLSITNKDFKPGSNPYTDGLSLMLVLKHKYGQDALDKLIRGDLTPLEGL